MKKGCLTVIALLGVLWIIGWIADSDKGQPSNQSGKVAYTCIWCQKMFVGDEGDLSCYYYDENAKGCGYHTVGQNTQTGFCTIEHCNLYKVANNSEVNSTVDKNNDDPTEELKNMFKKDGSDIESCPSKSIHYKIQYPYTCPDCSYVGKNQ